ncbi:YciI family protein [Actinocorallia populi]|uniref:YciI family protein n=1 Tax=Actinocorallia populi TaxID=2079200 RepID=UPI000D097BAE|nr:YciI family protein [Actinocorallia populi]
MRYLVAFKSASPTEVPPPDLMEAVMSLSDEATKAGVLLDTGGLLPGSMGGARVGLFGGELTVADGPFAESREMVSYGIYQVRDKAEAVEWTGRFLALYRDLWPGWEGEADILEIFGM